MRRLFLALVAATLVPLAACKDDAPPPDPEFLPPPEQALELTNANRGLYARLFTSLRNDRDAYERDLAFVETVVVTEQIISEFELTRLAPNEKAQARLQNRVEALYDDDVLGPLVSQAARSVLVVDLMRVDDTWLVDWEDLDRDTPETRETSLTFQVRADQHEADYQEAIVERTLDAIAAMEPTPSLVVLGHEMEQHYANAPGDWPYFVDLAHQVRSAVRETYPETRVSVGINWSNFVDTIAPLFLEEGETVPDFLTVQAAWYAVIDPLVWDAENEVPRMDAWAFSSVPDPTLYAGGPSSLPDWHYAGVPTMLDEEPARSVLPVYWYSIGWPTETTDPVRGVTFLTRFLELNGGYPIELVSWQAYNALMDSECDRIRDPDDIGGTLVDCYRGMYPHGALLTQDNALVARFFGR